MDIRSFQVRGTQAWYPPDGGNHAAHMSEVYESFLQWPNEIAERRIVLPKLHSGSPDLGHG